MNNNSVSESYSPNPTSAPIQASGQQRLVESGQSEMPPSQPNKIRPIEIRELNRGYIVVVGCHSFAIETAEKLSALLTAYLHNPQGTEDKWFKGELF